MSSVTSYPLVWPEGWSRTPPTDQQWGPFKVHPERAKKELLEEIRLLGGTDVIVSSNIPVRRDGLPYANARQPNDPGVAIYFTYQSRQVAFACDRYDKVWKNIRAIGLTIGHLRGLTRHGTSEMMDRAFTGYAALPSPEQSSPPGWREMFGFMPADKPTLDQVKNEYHRLAKMHHPDQGGNEHMSRAVNAAWERAKKELESANG